MSRFCAAMRPTASMIFGSSKRDLPLQIRQALGAFGRRRIPVTRRPALQHVGDIDLSARKTDGAQHGIEELTCAADEGLATAVFLGAGRLSDHQPVGVPDRRHRIRFECASGSGRSACSAATRTAQLLPIVLSSESGTGARAGADGGTGARPPLACVQDPAGPRRAVSRLPARDTQRECPGSECARGAASCGVGVRAAAKTCDTPTRSEPDAA